MSATSDRRKPFGYCLEVPRLWLRFAAGLSAANAFMFLIVAEGGGWNLAGYLVLGCFTGANLGLLSLTIPTLRGRYEPTHD